MEETQAQAGCPVAHAFDPFDISDPFDFYARARAEEPVFFSEQLGYWVVSRYEDILAIFKDPKTFSSENTQAPYKPRPPEVQRVLEEGDFRAYSGLSARQPPDHTRLRGFINKAFTPRRVATLEPEVRELAVGMIGRFACRGQADLVAELARDLPARVIFRLLGIPDEDVPRVKEWAESRVFMNFGDLPIDEQVHHAENLVKYWNYCLELIEKRFEEPLDDLPSDLVRIYRSGDESISIDEMAGLVYGQLTAGHETTTSLLAEGLRLLLIQHERWEDICEDPSLIPAAVEELLRLSTPVFAWKRKVKQPATIAGVEVAEGDNVLLLLGSANHDGSVFADPEAIDLARENARNHLSFGHGIHFCLGASLARLEGQVVLEELTRRVPGLRLAPGQSFDYTANTTFRAPHRVLAEWELPLVIGLERCSSADVELVGGKAASLGEMIQAGLPVPPGFAVTTAAFDPDGGVPEQEIRAAYRELCGDGGEPVPVAVRSSATAEDSAEASFAGMQDTYLWITGEDQVIEHVKRCWASLWSDRSQAYRHDRGFDRVNVRMGVAVQRMVRASSAGVAMTLNPVNGDRSKIAIESSFGLGETVVGGTVTPDSFLVDKVMLALVESKINSKDVELVPDPAGHGVHERTVEPERKSRPSLSSEEAVAVAALAKRAEQHYGSPQDVEWAIEDGSVVLLQSRPETVWSRKPAPEPQPSAYSLGLGSLVQTLVNPLASRR
ncbi:MAG: cytochrome P450, partial [Thermoleophilaceae bacterium]